jgi:hypothetical protein
MMELGDERNGIHRGRHIPQGVEPLVRGRQVGGLSSDRDLNLPHLPPERLHRDICPKPWNRFELVNGAAGVA